MKGTFEIVLTDNNVVQTEDRPKTENAAEKRLIEFKVMRCGK